MKSSHYGSAALPLFIAAVLGSSQFITAKQGENHRGSQIGGSAAALHSEETIARTPERLARGQYLVDGLLQCPFCHSENDYKRRPLAPLPGMKGGGRVFDRTKLYGPGAQLVAPNISSDREYGAGKWSDDDFVRALRQGIGHDGRALDPMMPYTYFRDLSDEDLASVVVFERSLAPVHVQRPKSTLPESVMKTYHPLPPVEHVPEPDKSDRLGYGKYLVTGAHCIACHTPHDENGNLISGLEFSGGQIFTGPFGSDGKMIQLASLNITSDPSGISYLDESKFIEVIRTGKATARPLATIMPWSYFRDLTDDDLKAIFAYLRTRTPVKHRVDNTEAPTYCRLCRHMHGLGDKN